MIEACTIISGNYLSHAQVLAESFLERNPGGRFVVLVTDDEARAIVSVPPPGCHYWRLSDIGLASDEIGRLAGIYDVTELATAVKPLLLRRLLDEGRDHIIYLDPDIKVYASLEPVADLARSRSIVLTPHTMVPVPRDDRRIATGNILASGVFNLGFIALGRNTDGFLAWWWEQTRREALSDIGRMMFTDQRVMDLVPCFFEHFILKDPGYNVAYWNLHARDLQWSGDGYTVDGLPLRFFHFSGFDHRSPYLLSKHQVDQPRILLSERPAVGRICQEYLGDLTRCGVFAEGGRPYGWAQLPGGIPVGFRIRRLYRDAILEAEKDGTLLPPNPFDSQRAGDFVRWLNEPVQPEVRPTISRLLYYVYTERPDLRAAFPQLAGDDAWRYLTWFLRDGIYQERLSAELMPTLETVRRAQERVFARPQELTPGINLVGYFRTITGVGEQGRLLAASLEANGVPFGTVTVGGTLSREGQDHLERGDPRALHDCNVMGVNADQTPDVASKLGPSFFEGRYTAGYWSWELERLPEAMYPAFDIVDEVWCASQFVTDAVRAANRRPAFTVPYPFAVPASRKDRTRAMYGLPDRFMFLFIFDFLSIPERKNPLGLIDAFTRAFSPDDEPVLVIKSINGNRRLNYAERLRARVANVSNVMLLEDYLTAEEKNGLVAVCDSYVSLHRSEGTGLTLAEAMALGKPVIGTGYSGNLEFMTEHNSYLVDYVKTEVPAGCEPYPQGYLWADPVLDHAAEAMSRVYGDRDEAARRGARARQDILAQFNPACGPKLAARLEAVRRAAREKVSLATARSETSQTAPLPTPELLNHAKSMLTPTADVSPQAGLRTVRLAMQRAVLRLIRPYWWGQRQLTNLLIEAIQGVEDARNKVESSLSERMQALESSVGVLHSSGTGLQSSATTLQASVTTLQASVTTLQSSSTGLQSSVSGFQRSAAGHLASLTESVSRLEAQATELLHRLYPVPYLANPDIFTVVDSSGRKALGFQAAGESRGSYIGFEDIFRGSEDFIRDRFRAYRGLLEQTDTVVDVGCGRGELLEVVRELGKTGIGVDADEEMVRRCLAKGLNATRADGNEFLRAQKDSSIGLIFASQIIEHMSHEAVSEFFDLAFQKLKPHGIVIAETVNPHSLEALKSFWVDLTHRHPIFPEVALALCRLRGFESASIMFPHGSGELEADRRTQGEYAVVARKPGRVE